MLNDLGPPWAEDTTIVFIVGLVTLPTPVDALLPPAVYIACNTVESIRRHSRVSAVKPL